MGRTPASVMKKLTTALSELKNKGIL